MFTCHRSASCLTAARSPHLLIPFPPGRPRRCRRCPGGAPGSRVPVSITSSRAANASCADGPGHPAVPGRLRRGNARSGDPRPRTAPQPGRWRRPRAQSGHRSVNVLRGKPAYRALQPPLHSPSSATGSPIPAATSAGDVTTTSCPRRQQNLPPAVRALQPRPLNR